jgi:hypothetical protein
MRRSLSFVLLSGLPLMLAGCGLPDAVAQGVKSVERSFGGSGNPPPAAPPPAAAPARANEPPPPTPAQRDSVKVEQLQ